MTWLLILGDDGSERIVELDTDTVRIGRAADNDIALADEAKSVSRAHAELRREEGRWYAVDLESQNGTWLNGHRIIRTELPLDGELTIGTFRLKRHDDDRPAAASPASSRSAGAPSTWVDVEIARTGSARQSPAARPRSRIRTVVASIVAGMLVIAGITWGLSSRGGSHSSPSSAASARAEAPPSAPVPSPASAPSVATNSSAEPGPPTTDMPASAVTARRTPRAALPPVPRKPDETEEAWHNRVAALEARYEYSTAALDRGDFGSAASGFEAILRAEPGFSDAPDLLVRARAGLRSTAATMVAAGNKLDSAGDWVGALQQYERARQVDPAAPGLAAGMTRVKDKLQVAGRQAYNKARESERQGNGAVAVQEYTKALQWLPTEDPNHAAAQLRLEQLQASKKD